MSEEVKDPTYRVIEMLDIDLPLALEAIALIFAEDYSEEHMVLRGFSYNLKTRTLKIHVEIEK